MSEPRPVAECGGSELDYLTPGQRLNAIAEILATIALRAVNQSQENQSHEDQNA